MFKKILISAIITRLARHGIDSFVDPNDPDIVIKQHEDNDYYTRFGSDKSPYMGWKIEIFDESATDSKQLVYVSVHTLEGTKTFDDLEFGLDKIIDVYGKKLSLFDVMSGRAAEMLGNISK